MAGIGFELRRILARDSYSATLRAYVYAGLISSGPWVLSIISVMLIGFLSLGIVLPSALVRQFLVTVTYLMASSLIITGGLQLFFTRFVSDRLFEKRLDMILPNLLGVLFIITVGCGMLGAVVLALLFDQSFTYRTLVLANFVVLCDLWIVIIFLSGMKQYNRILIIMFCGYALMVLSALLLRHWQLDGLLLEGVNGTGGSVYLSVPLSGSIPADGVFVIADDAGGGTTLVGNADLVADADFQNGPDSILLRDGDTVLDAVGYGDFSSAVFAGEGSPAVAVPAGSSLARLNPSLDTDDNLADFTALALPTPGTVPVSAVPLPAPLGLLLSGLAGLGVVARRKHGAG